MSNRNIFIGREEELDILRRRFFITEPGAGYCAAVQGPNDIGKTMLVRKAAQEFESKPHPNVYYFKTSVMASGSYWNFWGDLIMDFSERLPEEVLVNAPIPDPDRYYVDRILTTYKFFMNEDNMARVGTKGFHNTANRLLNGLFPAYTELGIHILITIDEFDQARTAFPVDGGDGSFFMRLFSLSPKAGTYNLSILLISRRRAGTIAHHMADGSNFESAYPPELILRGFSNEEIEEYFETYRELPCGIPEEEQRQKILYYCGRHPGLLMQMRAQAELHCKDASWNPGEIYRDYGSPMTTMYERMSTLLRREYVSRESERNCVGVFSQLFVGPAYDENLSNLAGQLCNYGLLAKWDQAGPSVFQLAGINYEGENRFFEYEPMSPYYVEFFRWRILPEERKELDRVMTRTELNIRQAILTVLKLSHEDWEMILENQLNTLQRTFRRNLDRIAMRNDADSRNITCTDLDVMNYKAYTELILAYWDEMRSYFRSFPNRETLAKVFEFLGESRNCFAHNNQKILDERSCEKIRSICGIMQADFDAAEAGKAFSDADVKVFRGFSQNVVMEAGSFLNRSAGAGTEQPSATGTGMTAAAAASSAGDEPNLGKVIPDEEQVRALMNQKVTFVHQVKKKPKGNLRGYIKGLDYPASITKVDIPAFGFRLPPVPGQEIEAVVVRWDSNGKVFGLRAPQD